jgi:hypothetical protein
MNQRATKRKEKTTYDLQNEKQEEISILMRFRLIYIYIYTGCGYPVINRFFRMQ